MGWGSAIAQVVAAAGVGHARGKFNRQQMDRQEMLQALAIEGQKRKEKREQESHDLGMSNIRQQMRAREEGEGRKIDKDMLGEGDRLTKIAYLRSKPEYAQSDEAELNGIVGNEDAYARASGAKQAPAWHPTTEAEALGFEARKRKIHQRYPVRSAGSEPRPDQREKAADEYAYRMVSAANGDPRVAQDYGARDMATAKKLGLRRDHYYAAAQRFKDRKAEPALTPKQQREEDEKNGIVPTSAKSYSSDPMIRTAREMWDRNPTIQAKRPRPESVQKPLTAADRAKARTDPKFRKYLEDRGYKL